MRKRLDVPVGTRFERLTVVGEVEPRKDKNGVSRRFVCNCECGNELIADLRSLRSGHNKSCGCYKADAIRVRSTTHGHTANTLSSIYYNLWCAIKVRSVFHTGPKADMYLRVSMFPPWRHDFAAFYAYIMTELGPRPDECSLDRIDNDGDYAPGNVRWATPMQQAQNTRRNINLTFAGKTQCLSQWARDTGISVGTLRKRIVELGWPVERALTTPPNGLRKFETTAGGYHE